MSIPGTRDFHHGLLGANTVESTRVSGFTVDVDINARLLFDAMRYHVLLMHNHSQHGG